MSNDEIEAQIPCKFCCPNEIVLPFLQDLKKLKWQCRRGTQELDKLLLSYLEKEYAQAQFTEQQQFQRLLGLSDRELLQLFFNETDLNWNKFHAMVEKIRFSATIYRP